MNTAKLFAVRSKGGLFASVGLAAFAATFAAPAMAQTAATTAADCVDTNRDGVCDPVTTTSEESPNEIVVTGTILRNPNLNSASPITSLSAESLQQRGVNTVEDAIQRLSSNGAGTLPTSFSASGAFASGASAASLRGLTTSSTLVLFDGLRAAYYPLADDGTRNFVDMNAIPQGVVERIDVLKDGASATYGADAVAGVINIVTKKNLQGVKLNASAGVSERGDAAEQRIDGSVGYGDLNENGFNVYVAGEYQNNDMLYNRDRGFPYNTSNLSSMCATSSVTGAQTCRTNNIANGTQFDGSYAGLGTTVVPVVRPYTAANGTIAGSRYQLLNPALGCYGGTNPVTLTAAQAASTAGATAAINNCSADPVNLYSVLLPKQERIGGTARATVKVGDQSEFYAMFNYYQSRTSYTGTPQALRATTPAGGTTLSTANLALPIYVCNRNGADATLVNTVPTVAGCTAANGTLNPNNPFAAAGQTARIVGRLSDIPLSNERLAQSYRGAIGLNGVIGEDWRYSLEAVAMRQDLKATYNGYIYVQNLINAIADGSYNFVNPSLNSQQVRDYVAPQHINRSNSQMYQVQGNISKTLFELPGGPLELGVGASWRRESVEAPSANPVVAGKPAQRYFTINGFGTSGKREVTSAYFELSAPVLEILDLSAAGRYDHYSSGQNNFSPKFGAVLNPVNGVKLRGTYSRGFRIPSFAEAYGLPTTGYVTNTPPASYQAQCATPKPAYCTAAYSVGLTSVGNPNLKPEKSSNLTAGIVIEPTRNVSLSVDYYRIKKTDLISGADYAPAVAAYYAGGGTIGTLPDGITGYTVDPNFIPGQGAPYALLNTVEYGFINADSARSEGIDFDLEARFPLSDNVTWRTSLEATHVLELSTTIGGVKQRFDDTLGPYQLTSASGTPKWRGSWQNSLDMGKLSLTGTLYYSGGYGQEAEDDGNTRGVCDPADIAANGAGSIAVYRDGVTPVVCRVKAFWNFDLSASVKVSDNFTFYGVVRNLFDTAAPLDPSTYGQYQFNPAWATQGVIGRYFRVGARVSF